MVVVLLCLLRIANAFLSSPTCSLATTLRVRLSAHDEQVSRLLSRVQNLKWAGESSAGVDGEIAQIAWACVDAQLRGAEDGVHDTLSARDDCAGFVLEAYCSKSGCSTRRAPPSLVAAAVASAALVGEIRLVDRRLEAVDVELLDDADRSRLVSALCKPSTLGRPYRKESLLRRAMSMVDDEKSWQWLTSAARKDFLDATIANARDSAKSRRLDDDEATLLSYGGEYRALSDMLPPYEDFCVDETESLDRAERLARDAPRGRARRDALARVAALAYLCDDNARSLDGVKQALRRATLDKDFDEKKSTTLAAPVLRAVLREALGRGDKDSAEDLLDELAKRDEWNQNHRDHNATLDVVVEACAADGDYQGAYEAWKAMSERKRSSMSRPAALVLKACLPAVAASGKDGNTANAIVEEVLIAVNAEQWRRDLRLAHASIRAARALASSTDRPPPLTTLFDGEPGPSSFVLAAVLEGCEAVAKARDAIETFGDTTRPPTRDDWKCSIAAFDAVSAFYRDRQPAPYIVQSLMRIFAVEGAADLAASLAASRPNDLDARYGALRCCALAATPENVNDLLDVLDNDSPNTLRSLSDGDAVSQRPFSRVAIAVALGRAGDPEDAERAWKLIRDEGLFEKDPLGGADALRKARSAVVASLVSHPRGALLAAKLVEDFTRDDAYEDVELLRVRRFGAGRYDDDRRVRAALAKRLGNARNWADAATASSGGQAVVRKVGETTYARLASALVRCREARDAKEAVVLLTSYGIKVESNVQSYLDESEPRKRGTELYKALFGGQEPPKDAEKWYDSRAERAPPPVDLKRNRENARKFVVDAKLTADEDETAPANGLLRQPRGRRRRR